MILVWSLTGILAMHREKVQNRVTCQYVDVSLQLHVVTEVMGSCCISLLGQHPWEGDLLHC